MLKLIKFNKNIIFIINFKAKIYILLIIYLFYYSTNYFLFLSLLLHATKTSKIVSYLIFWFFNSFFIKQIVILKIANFSFFTKKIIFLQK